MIFDPKIFYQTYLKDYHKVKANYLKGMLDNFELYQSKFFGDNIDEEEKEVIRRTIKSDLRQTYFHSIETFFELFFALEPKNKMAFDDEAILLKMTNSKWQDNLARIKKIAEDKNALNFLEERISVLDFNITTGHYLFYMGIFDTSKFPEELFENIGDSLDAIRYGIEVIAKDYVNRGEYNAYKHGLRIIPAANRLMFADPKTMKILHEWDLKDSMSFYIKTKTENELTVVTKVFDPERDYQMILFCSNLIHHLIYFRRASMKLPNENEEDELIKITMFGKESIDNCNQINVVTSEVVSTMRFKSKKPLNK